MTTLPGGDFVAGWGWRSACREAHVAAVACWVNTSGSCAGLVMVSLVSNHMQYHLSCNRIETSPGRVCSSVQACQGMFWQPSWDVPRQSQLHQKWLKDRFTKNLWDSGRLMNVDDEIPVSWNTWLLPSRGWITLSFSQTARLQQGNDPRALQCSEDLRKLLRSGGRNRWSSDKAPIMADQLPP